MNSMQSCVLCMDFVMGTLGEWRKSTVCIILLLFHSVCKNAAFFICYNDFHSCIPENLDWLCFSRVFEMKIILIRYCRQKAKFLLNPKTNMVLLLARSKAWKMGKFLINLNEFFWDVFWVIASYKNLQLFNVANVYAPVSRVKYK